MSWERAARPFVMDQKPSTRNDFTCCAADKAYAQASEAGENPNAVGFSVAVCLLPELRVAGPVPGVLKAPTIANVSEKCVVAAGPVRYHPVKGRNAAQSPGDVAAMADVVLAGLEQASLAIGQPIQELLKSYAESIFYRDQDV